MQVQEPPRPVDLAVIGAGINGAGIARDAALRGLSVVVLEQGDFCSGTSWASSRLIHGGLRYLEHGEVPLVYESLRERRTLRRIAGHLVHPLRICIPIYAGARRGPLLIRAGMIVYDLLSLGKLLKHHKMLDRDEIVERAPGLRRDGLRAAACYYDAQVTFAERLVLENLLAARAAGAEILSYHRVTGLTVRDGAIDTLNFVDTLTGEAGKLRPRAVVNAAGPWVDAVLETAGTPSQLIGGTKGSHIVVSPFGGAPGDAFYVEAATDGRPFFIIPWNGLFLIGTTDIRYDGDPAQVRASRAEIDYLVDETNRVFPEARLAAGDVHYAYAGVRPLPHRDKGPESAITRKHIIKVHHEFTEGLLSIVGGKLTTYRNLAEQTVDKVGRILGRKLPECRTGDTLLPGAWGIPEAREALAGVDSLSAAGIERLVAVYGGRAAGIARIARARPELASCLDARGALLAAEIAWVAAEEMPRTLVDVVFRRTMVGLDADQGRAAWTAIAQVAAAELGWDAQRTARELGALSEHADSLKTNP